jgi:hypothetical protein
VTVRRKMKTRSKEKHGCIRLGLKQEKRQQRQEKLMLKDKLAIIFNMIYNEYFVMSIVMSVKGLSRRRGK